MKKVLLVLMALLICSTSAFAEATFDQIQGLIKAHDYAPAVQGLQLIIQNHPKSAKAYYAMSQAQAGMGNQIKAKEALDMATGIDPSLKFASAGNVEKLKDAIQPQTKKIEAIESHTARNCLVLLLVAGVVCFFIFRRKKKDLTPIQRYKEEPERKEPHNSEPPRQSSTRSYESLSPYQPAPHHNPSPSYPPMPSPVHHMTVVNNGGGSDLITCIVLGEMMAGSHGHRETVVEREYVREEVVREIPAPSRSSSWDEKPSSSSTWDDGGSPSSSSWDSGSSNSSSSWDSGSSDSSSSSSWDD